MKIKDCDDVSLRISELTKSLIHYENDKIVLKNRKIECQGLINYEKFKNKKY